MPGCCAPLHETVALVETAAQAERQARRAPPAGCGLLHWTTSWLTPSRRLATTLVLGWRNCSSRPHQLGTFTLSSAFLDEGILHPPLAWKHPMGAGLCDGIEAVRPPPLNTPSHYRGTCPRCSDASCAHYAVFLSPPAALRLPSSFESQLARSAALR